MAEDISNAADELQLLLQTVISKRKKYPLKILTLEKKRINKYLQSLAEAKVDLDDDDYLYREIVTMCERSEELLEDLPKDRGPSPIEVRLKRNKRMRENIQRYLAVKENNYDCM